MPFQSVLLPSHLKVAVLNSNNNINIIKYILIKKFCDLLPLISSSLILYISLILLVLWSFRAAVVGEFANATIRILLHIAITAKLGRLIRLGNHRLRSLLFRHLLHLLRIELIILRSAAKIRDFNCSI